MLAERSKRGYDLGLRVECAWEEDDEARLSYISDHRCCIRNSGSL